MTENINAILINEKDNVVTVKRQLSPGDLAVFQTNDGIKEVTVRETVPKFHKLALEEISETKPVYKYGQLIGQATTLIERGCHVHDHNLVSPEKQK